MSDTWKIVDFKPVTHISKTQSYTFIYSNEKQTPSEHIDQVVFARVANRLFILQTIGIQLSAVQFVKRMFIRQLKSNNRLAIHVPYCA